MQNTVQLTQTSAAAEQPQQHSRRARMTAAVAILFGMVVIIDLLALQPQKAGIVRSPAVPYLALLGLGALAQLLLRLLALAASGRRRAPARPAPERLFAIRQLSPWERLALTPVRRGAFVLAMLAFDRSIHLVVGWLWPGAPIWPIWVPMIGLFYLLAPGLSRANSRVRGNLPTGRPVRHEFQFATSTILIWAGAGLLLMWVLDWLAPLLGRLSPLLRYGTIASLSGLTLAALALLAYWLASPFWRIDQALRRADYKQAEDYLQRPEGLITPAIQMQKLGTVLFWEGRLRESALCLRRSLAEGQDDVLFRPGVALDRLGDVLLAQENYEEAMQAYAAAIEIDPSLGHPYSGQAEVYLRQGVEPERALKLASWGLQIDRQSLLRRFARRRELSELWANEAQALAAMDYPADADACLAAAFREGDPNFKPGLAALHYRVGLAMAFRDLLVAAEAHFRSAQQTDPSGLYGQMAAYCLRQVQEAAAAGGAAQNTFNLMGVDREDLMGLYAGPASFVEWISRSIRDLVDKVNEWLG